MLWLRSVEGRKAWPVIAALVVAMQA